MNEGITFSNFVSLGRSCTVSASMSKYGLRSWSGPFDWLITEDFSWVLHYMENDFEDFLEKENLEMFQDNPKRFKERNSGFVFMHEKCLFDKEYEKLKAKYSKRIDKFLCETRKTTCFFRAVNNCAEITYIVENRQYINKVVQKYNNHNQMIFLIREDIEIPKNMPFQYYVMKKSHGVVSRELLRGWFDREDEFLSFCAKHFDMATMMRNIMFDQEKEYKHCQITKQRYDILVKLLETDFENILLPEKIIIYGAGNIGKQFYMRIKEKCRIVSFVDEGKKGTMIEEVPIVNLEEINYKEKIPFVITPTYDFQNIYDEIRHYDRDAKIISLEVILNGTG